MRLGEGRILKLVMLEALELGKGVRWVKDLQSSLEMFGGSALMVEALSGLSMRVLKHLVKYIAWRKVREGWREEASGRSKLEVIGRLIDGECMSCTYVCIHTSVCVCVGGDQVVQPPCGDPRFLGYGLADSTTWCSWSSAPSCALHISSGCSKSLSF